MVAPRASIRLALGSLLSCFAAAALLVNPFAEGAEEAFVYALEGAPESLDTAKTTSDRANHIAWLLCDALVSISKDGQSLEPGLAESWSLSADGLQAVIKLRGGAVFHDGTPVNAAAVKASFERQFLPAHELYTSEAKNTKEQMLSELIEEIQVGDPVTLIFRLKYPGFHYLSQVDVVSPVGLARLGKEFGRNPICSGPFRFAEWLPDKIVVTANDKYWAGRPRIDRVVVRFIPGGRALVDALLAGEVDFAPGIPDPSLFERLRESPRVKLVPVPELNVFYLGFYTERPPFSNPALRRAVAHGLNVPRTGLFLGRGSAVPAKGPFPPNMKGYDAAVAQASYATEAARKLLSKGGYPSGLSVGLVYNSAVSFNAELAGAIQSDLRRIGIQVQLLGKPSWRDVVTAVQAREGDMFVYGWFVRAPYPERLLFPLFHSRSLGTSNLTHYANPALDKMLEEAFRLPEGTRQTGMYSKIQKAIVEDAPMVFLYHSIRMAAYAARVQGLELNLGSLPHDKLVRVTVAP